MVLMSVHNSEGCVGRCDARCYNAKEPHCDCICGGRNHGRGLEKALAQTREQFAPMIEEYARRNGLEGYTSKLGPEMGQLVLMDVLAGLEG